MASLVADGLTNREIAARMFISERTVDGHLEHIREKLGVNSRAQVAAWFARQGDALASPVPEPSQQVARRGKLVAHPRLWLATALCLALVAMAVGLLRLMEPAPPIIETIAGSQCDHQVYPGGCWGGDPDLATRAWLARPMSVAAARDGSIYIADNGNRRVRRVSAGFISTVFGGGPESIPLVDDALATSAYVEDVSAVAVDNQNRLLVLAAGARTVGVWRLDGLFAHLLMRLPDTGETSSVGLPGPDLPLGGLAVAGDGTIFASDREHNQVWKLSPLGVKSLYAGSGDQGYSDQGGATDAKLAWPIGLAVARSGDLYIADALNNRIRMVDGKGSISTVAGSASIEGNSGDGGSGLNARLSFPFGVAVAGDGTIVIADTGNHRVRWISHGVINALAGTGRWGFAGDAGPASQAELYGPEAVIFDAGGDLLIADTENQRVREIPKLVVPGK